MTDTLVEHSFRREYGRLVALLTRRLGSARLELVEDAVQAALVRAMQAWPRSGIPSDPAGWLYRTARNAAIDTLRRESALAERLPAPPDGVIELPDDHPIGDEPLRMLFTCCHPELPDESRIALALKVVCGFGITEIARALLTTDANVQKRLTRAKDKLAEVGFDASEVPDAELSARRESMHSVLYLLFNEGYHSSAETDLIRRDVCEEAIRLAELLAAHPTLGSPASEALLALMLMHAARFDARQSESGELLLLAEQDRTKWDDSTIRAGFVWLERSARGDELSRYHLEAAILAEHCRAPTFAETDWDRIVSLYDMLCEREPSWLHALSRAVAVGERDGPVAGLAALPAGAPVGTIRYGPWHAARGEMLLRSGNLPAARDAFTTARDLAATSAERAFLDARIGKCV